jgi:hypothetical protein
VKKILINLALFQIGWFVCVMGGDIYAVVFTVGALLIHNWLVLTNFVEWKLIGIVVVVGCLWDISEFHFGWYAFGCCLRPPSCTACSG